MANVYLEKIASLAGAVAEGAAAVGRVAAKGVVNGAKALGKQVHLSMGGGFRDHAFHKLGIKDSVELARFGGSRKGINELRNATIKKANPKNSAELRAKIKEFRSKTVPQLKRDQTDARIITGTAVGATAYGAHKIKSKADEPNVQTYNY